MIVKDIENLLEEDDSFELTISLFKKGDDNPIREDNPIRTILIDRETKEVLFCTQEVEEISEIMGEEIKTTEERRIERL